MIYEFIATITAGFGMAGIAMIIRQITKLAGKQAPKWLIPIFAGVGMLGFQIHQEYHWHQQQINTLPQDVKVMKIVEGSTWYRPWSYLKPQVIRFMAIKSAESISHQLTKSDDTIKQTTLYLYERRISTKVIQQLINCSHPALATLDHDTPLSATVFQQLQWHQVSAEDPLIQQVCD